MTITIKRGEVFCFSLEFEKTLAFFNLFCTGQRLGVWSVPLLAIYKMFLLRKYIDLGLEFF